MAVSSKIRLLGEQGLGEIPETLEISRELDEARIAALAGHPQR